MSDSAMSDTEMVDSNGNSNDQELEAWKEVHQQLINAVLISKDAIGIQKAQRRYWLTEINANLTPDDGQLTPKSVWKRPSNKKRSRPPLLTTTTAATSAVPESAADKQKKKKKRPAKQPPQLLDAGGNPKKKRKYTKKMKVTDQGKTAVAAAAAASKMVTVEEDDDDDDEDDEDDVDSSSVPQGKKLRLVLHSRPPMEVAAAAEETSQEDEDGDGDEETEDEEEDEDEHASFLGGASGALAPAVHDSPQHDDDPNSYSSFLPTGAAPSFMMQSSARSRASIMAPSSYAMPEHPDEDDSDDDTEEDDY